MKGEDIVPRRNPVGGCPWRNKTAPRIDDPFRLAVLGSDSLGEGWCRAVWEVLYDVTALVDFMHVHLLTEGHERRGRVVVRRPADGHARTWAEKHWYDRHFHQPEWERYGHDAEAVAVMSAAEHLTKTGRNLFLVLCHDKDPRVLGHHARLMAGPRGGYARTLRVRLVHLKGKPP